MNTKAFVPSQIENLLGFVPKSGRALVFPIYKSTFERRDGYGPGQGAKTLAARRDHLIMWGKDLSRTLDYIATRKDMDSGRLAFAGFSWGAQEGVFVLAVEGRFKAAILISGGFRSWRALPQTDPLNYAPRVVVPVLMLSDRFDNIDPEESSQLPMFRLLGTPDADKRRVVYDSDHGGLPRRELVRETLAWLDKYLGPVKR